MCHILHYFRIREQGPIKRVVLKNPQLSYPPPKPLYKATLISASTVHPLRNGMLTRENIENIGPICC